MLILNIYIKHDNIHGNTRYRYKTNINIYT